jgi:2-oxoglutarate ferredoxin oxidoreductase subunit beta
MTKVFVEAEKHRGTAMIEVLQNCVIFNDGAFDEFTAKDVRPEKLLHLEHGKPMIFGKEKNKGIRLNGLKLEVVEIGENGVSEADLLVHDAKNPDPALHFMLIHLKDPLPVGIIRAVEDMPFGERVYGRIGSIQEKAMNKTVNDLLYSGQTYTI